MSMYMLLALNPLIAGMKVQIELFIRRYLCCVSREGLKLRIAELRRLTLGSCCNASPDSEVSNCLRSS